MTAMITSRQHPVCKLVRSLHEPKGRKKSNLFVAEGGNSVVAALRARWPLERLLAAPATLSDGWDEVAADAGVPVQAVDEDLMEYLSDAQPGAEVIALCKMPTAVARLENREGLTLVLDGIGDPGNIGTLLRTADAAGASRVICTAGCADPYGPKAVRASAGSLFHLPPVPLPDRSPEGILEALGSTPLAIGVAHGGENLFSMHWPGTCALVLGHETRGISPEFETAATLRVTIPVFGRAESLNVAAAGAVLAYSWRGAQESAPVNW